MHDHRSRLFNPGRAQSGGAPLSGARGLPCRYAECRALFSAPGMSGSVAVLREVAGARDAHELTEHGGPFVSDRRHVDGPDVRRSRWAAKGPVGL